MVRGCCGGQLWINLAFATTAVISWVFVIFVIGALVLKGGPRDGPEYIVVERSTAKEGE